ncbi:hypothetical protein FRC09_003338 [Ceratobasidium sp. 395]|nr:hypothetical protein FRC09_003338 [Ceratobasidium sp. 395]
MPLLHLDHPHTPGTPPDRCRAAPARSIHKIALMNSLAALRTDIVSPVKSNSLLANQRNAEMWSPSSHASTNSTPFMTPRSSLSPVHSAGLGGVAILEHISVLPETEPTAGELIPKSIDPLTFRSLFNSISTEGDVLLVSDPQYIQAAEIIPLLVNSGCPDVTHKLDLDQCGTDPVAGGGFGDIFQGGLVGGVKVAIKRPRLFLKNDEQGKRVLKNVAREIYAWSKLEHPNVLELIGFSTFRGRISTVSAWMENGTLPEYISKYPSVDRFELIHGDVKGSNVLVSESGVAKLADFGNTVIKKLHTLSFTDSTGRRGISARWTAPELFEDGEQLSREADIYALGMVSNSDTDFNFF